MSDFRQGYFSPGGGGRQVTFGRSVLEWGEGLGGNSASRGEPGLTSWPAFPLPTGVTLVGMGTH